ncbi:MAG: hypothetical protein EBV84_13590, partial [Betaproteobacteria bacterium]|nr:hypothetical protein [Betaproteobacteria bacterium]
FGFTEDALFVSGAQAQFLGGSVAIDGKTDTQAVLRLQAKGRASAQGLQSLVLHPAMKRLEGYLDYQAEISLEGQGMDLRLQSDGLGLASRLPPPLTNKASSVKPNEPRTFDMLGNWGAKRSSLPCNITVPRTSLRSKSSSGKTSARSRLAVP